MATGFFGKLPSRGDFVTRRLPPAFVEPWDQWLQQGIHASRALLGTQWDALFDAAPLWRFHLPPGVAGATGWLGVLYPSADRVGRRFPLTIAAPAASASVDGVALLAHASPWFGVIEDLAKRARTADLDLEAFDAAVAGTMPEELRGSGGPSPHSGPSGVVDEYVAHALEPGASPASSGVRDRMAIGSGRITLLWWSAGPRTSCLLTSPALPDPGRFCVLVDPNADVQGWSRA